MTTVYIFVQNTMVIIKIKKYNPAINLKLILDQTKLLLTRNCQIKPGINIFFNC